LFFSRYRKIPRYYIWINTLMLLILLFSFSFYFFFIL
jgi:hypothetical protein